MNVSAHLATTAAADPDRAALVLPRRGGHDVVTAGELHAATDRLARGLTAAGVTPGTRVAVMVPPSRDFFAVTFALLKCAAVPVLIDPGMGVRGVGRCLAEADPAAFVGVPKAHLARRLFGWARGAALTVNAGRGRFFCRTSLARLARPGGGGPFDPPPVTADTVAAVLFTSGSTGPAKGAVYTHGVFAAQVESLRAVYGIGPGEVDLCTFPLFALFGPALGMTCVIPRMDPTRPATADPHALVRQANAFRVTNFFGSPAVLRNIAAAGDVPRVPTLRRVISAGAPATADVVARVAGWLPAGAQVFTPYGATEALPVANIGSREITCETRKLTEQGRGVCVGRPVPGVTVRVIRQTLDPIESWDESLELPRGEVGEFCVRGPVVTREYFRRPDATRLAKIADPATGGVWHRMGDVGYVDEQGRLWFCGRKAHVVWTAAGPLYPDQVEPVLNLTPGVARTALVGVTRGGETVPVVCYEASSRWGHPGWKARLGLAPASATFAALARSAAARPLTRGITTFLRHPAFPVDVRHNSKIFREKLAAWADELIGPEWGPFPPVPS